MLGALAGLVSLRQHHYAGQNAAGTRPRRPVAAHAADAWPTRDITFYVPYAPGGAAERISRRYAELTEKQLKLRVIVENKPGASATIGTGAAILIAGFVAAAVPPSPMP